MFKQLLEQKYIFKREKKTLISTYKTIKDVSKTI